MSRVLERCGRNDPQQTDIEIDLNHEHDDAALAQALEQNQYVSCVRLRPARRNAPWDNLLRVLATRGNLEQFKSLRHILSSGKSPIGKESSDPSGHPAKCFCPQS